MIVITGEENIKAAWLLSLRHALRLEALGMKRRGRSALAIIKEHTGLTGSRAKVQAAFDEYLRERGIPVT